MKKHLVTNLLLTFAFLLIITPLFIGLFHYVLNENSTVIAAKRPLSSQTFSSVNTNRDFANTREFASQVPVLTYHQIIPKHELQEYHLDITGELLDTVVTLEQFSEQMAFLSDEGYTVLSLREFELFMTKQKKVPAKSVLITFDDGFKNVFTFAYPVLKKHNFYAVHFIITGNILHDSVAYDSSKIQYASIDELLNAADVFDYGSHTSSFHQRNEDGLAFLAVYNSEQVRDDIAHSLEWIRHSNAFASPYGVYTEATLQILEELNVSLGFTIEPGYADPTLPLLEIPRHGIFPSYTMQQFDNIISLPQ